MSRPTLTVLTLLVLWLIVLVPMIFRSVDERAQLRSVRRFGRSMRLLNRGHVKAGGVSSSSVGTEYSDVTYVQPKITSAREELFVSGSRGHVRADADLDLEMAARRPVPAAQEAQMYSEEHLEMSAARRKMMARRRRSLTILGIGSVLGLLLSFVVGGALIAVATTMFVLGLGGYVYFLRSQALHDRERREHRQERAAARRPHSYEVAEAGEYVEELPASAVQIDDDSIELHNLDTIDLTGVYAEESFEPVARRRAS
jgi:hypothetical protein